MGPASESTLTASAAAFDTIADQYDTLFSADANPLIGLMRLRVHLAIARHFRPGSTLLEIGCGTGEDTLALAARGYRLVAVDPAPRMITQATTKLEAAGQASSVRFIAAGVEELARCWTSLGISVDGVFSNFAPLNCALSLDPVRTLLEQALRPGGRFVGVVLPRLCPLEIVLSLARGDRRTAFRRFRSQPIADVEGTPFPMKYYGSGDFDRALAGGFRRVETRSLGLCLPPLGFGRSFGRVPGLLTTLAALEDRLSGLPGLRRMGDHVLLAYERT